MTMTDECKNSVAEGTDAHSTSHQTTMSRKRILKNIFVLCVGAFILFTAYDGPTMLQSSMNKEEGIGVAALAINYAFFCISALLFPKYFIKRYGSKTTFLFSMVLYIPYIASNYYPHWAVMIPVAVLIGFSAALLWSSQATYLNDVSVMLAKSSVLNEEKNAGLFRNKVESTTARVFGIHGMSFLLSHLSGNLLAYLILKKGVDVSNVFINSTCAHACGAHYCNGNSNCLPNQLEEVSLETRIILTTVCVSLAIVSVLIVALFLEPLESKPEEAPFSLEFLMATYRITQRTDLILLIPYTLYLGQIQGFFTGEFNKAYVSCAWGTYHVSLVSITYGFFCAVFATSSGWIVKFFGRLALFTFAALLNIAFSALLLLWKPLHPEMFFTSAGMIGAFVGMSWSQFRAFYGILFKAEEEEAFGAFYVWYSIGFCLSFAYSTYFCTFAKIYVLLFVSSVGYIGYFIVEKRFSKLKNKGSISIN